MQACRRRALRVTHEALSVERGGGGRDGKGEPRETRDNQFVSRHRVIACFARFKQQATNTRNAGDRQKREIVGDRGDVFCAPTTTVGDAVCMEAHVRVGQKVGQGMQKRQRHDRGHTHKVVCAR